MNSLIQKTTNFGDTWVNLSSSVASGFLSQIEFPDPDRGFALAPNYQYGLLIRTNEKKHWEPVLTLPLDTLLFCSHFLSKDAGYTFGGYLNGNGTQPLIFKTLDGGDSWERSLPGITFRPFSIYFKNLNDGFMTGWADNIWPTNPS